MILPKSYKAKRSPSKLQRVKEVINREDKISNFYKNIINTKKNGAGILIKCAFNIIKYHPCVKFRFEHKSLKNKNKFSKIINNDKYF